MEFIKKFLISLKKEKILAGLYFDKGNASMFALDSRNTENPQNYYLEDYKKLNAIVKKWKFLPKDSLGRCGYDYIIHFENRHQKSHLAICFDCNTLIVNNSKIFSITEDEIRKVLTQDFILLKTIKKKFITSSEAKKFLEKNKAQPNILIIPEQLPYWLKYEGKFKVTVELSPTIIGDNEKEPSSVAEEWLYNKLKIISGNNQFLLQNFATISGENSLNFWIMVYCNKVLFDQVENLEKGSWIPFITFEMDVYYKTLNEL